jgi:fumarate hydratase class II
MTNPDNGEPKVLDIPIGLAATGTRREFDSLGEVEVPANRYWGAQTQRSLQHFNIGDDRMPKEVYHAYGYVKKAAAIVNTRAGRLPRWQGGLIQRVCDEVISGTLDAEFPLYVWQTGSGTQSNMNVNEVISNRCIQLVGGTLGSQQPVHPNDHVNMGQSSNDTFPTAMHIAAYTMATGKTIPALRRLQDAIEAKSKTWADVVKIGRTHLAMLMVAIRVISSDVAVTMGGAEGNFELNAFRPVLISNYLHSARIMADMCDHFREFMVEGADLNQAKLKENIDRSVMMVTALSPVIGYDQASVISHYAIDHDLTLKQAALANGVSEELFDRVVNPLALTRGGSADLPSAPGKA